MIHTLAPYLLIALVLWNLIVFLVYAVDKRKARKDKWRLQEKTLLICALLLGGVGAGAGMHFLHHKTQRIKFRVLGFLSFLVTAGVAAWLLYSWLAPFFS